MDNRIVKLAKESRKQPELKPVLAAAEAARAILDGGRTIAESAAAGEIDAALLADFHLLSAKPFIYVFNVDESSLTDDRSGRSWPGWWPRPGPWCCAPRSRPKWRTSTPWTPLSCWPATDRTGRVWCSWCRWGSPRSVSRPT